MVLKKPYAFIIKHFRLIHLIILGCLIYINFNINQIHNLFVNLQKSNTLTYSSAGTLINYHVLIVIGILIFFNLVLFILFKVKKKPTLLYFLLFVYNIVSFVGFLFLFYQLNQLQEKVFSSDMIILLKDISFLIFLPTFPFMLLSVIRGIGFDIKRFNFSKDIKDLELSDKDNEEVEIVLGKRNYVYLRFIRRTIREFKYFFIENKFAVTVLFSGIFLILFLFGLYFYNTYYKNLGVNETSLLNGLTYKINNSYITERDYSGNIVKDGYKYLIVDLNVTNTTNNSKNIDLSLISLADGDLVYRVNTAMISYFTDLGKPYVPDGVIEAGDNINTLLVFELPVSTTSNSFQFRIQESINNFLNSIIAKYKMYGIKPTFIDREYKTNEYAVGEKILVDQVSNNLDINVTNYSIQDSFNNKYAVCKKESCKSISSIISSTSNKSVDTMLVLDYDFVMGDNIRLMDVYNSNNKIFNNFATVEYDYNGAKLSDKVTLNDKSLESDKVFLNVTRKIVNANKINLCFNFRNNKYCYNLK